MQVQASQQQGTATCNRNYLWQSSAAADNARKLDGAIDQDHTVIIGLMDAVVLSSVSVICGKGRHDIENGWV